MGIVASRPSVFGFCVEGALGVSLAGLLASLPGGLGFWLPRSVMATAAKMRGEQKGAQSSAADAVLLVLGLDGSQATLQRRISKVTWRLPSWRRPSGKG